MSTTATPAARSPSEATQAYDHMMGQIYEPIFFNKLAHYGVIPQNDREREQLLYLGAHLYRDHQTALAKEAEKRGSFLDFAVARYDELAGAVQAGGGFSDTQVKTAAADFLTDPATLAAALTLAGAVEALQA